MTMANGKRDLESQFSTRSSKGLMSNSPTGKYSSHDYDDNCSAGFWTARMKCYVFSGISVFAFIALCVTIGNSAHKIREGTIGIYYRGGALQEKFSLPGIQFTVPFITDIERIKIRPRTDTLPPMKTITKDGIQNTFNNVQVISDVQPEKVVALVKKYGMEFHETLVFDRIKEEIRIFCASHTIHEVYNTMFLDIVKHVEEETKKTISKLGEGGITIHHLTIPKPDIPPDIAKNYKDVKVQWTKQLVATQQQKTEKIKKETESLKAVADAERSKKVQEIDITKQILRKKGDKEISSLNNLILKEQEENKANVTKYAKEQLAAANSKLFDNQGYVQLEMAKALSQNTKFFFSGEGSPLGSVLAKIMGNGGL